MALANTSRDRHHRTTPRTHGETRVLREDEDAAAADAGDAELLDRGDGGAHRAADGGCTDGVGQGDVALLAGDLPGGLRSVRHGEGAKIQFSSLCLFLYFTERASGEWRLCVLPRAVA